MVKLELRVILITLMSGLFLPVITDGLKDMNVVLEFQSDQFLSVNFDSSFYNALFIDRKESKQRLLILDFETMGTKEYKIKLGSNFLFSGILNSGNIVIGCDKHAYFLSKLDGYSTMEMPSVSSMFQNNKISNKTFFNDFNQTLLLVYNENRLVELDVRLPLEASANLVKFGTSEAFSNTVILGMVYASSGKKFAVLSSRNNVQSVTIYDQKTKERIKTLGREADGTVKMAYNVELDLLVLVKKFTKTMLLYNSDSFRESGIINYSLTGLDPDKIDAIYSPLGTKVLLICSSFRIYLFDLESKKFITDHIFPVDTYKVYWAESTSYFLAEKLELDGMKKFEVFKLETPDPRFCHKSCGPGCASVFIPCFNLWMIAFSMILGFTIMAIVSCLAYLILVKLVKAEDDHHIVDAEGNIYELTETGTMKPRRNTITLETEQMTQDAN